MNRYTGFSLSQDNVYFSHIGQSPCDIPSFGNKLDGEFDRDPAPRSRTRNSK
jgi:hypothetical protein